MSETAIATTTVTDDQLALVKRTVAAGATDEELRLFLYDCQRHGVHPLDKMLHFTKRKGKYTPITSIDLMRTQAAETGEMAGSDDPVFGFEDDDPASGWARVTVYRLTHGTRYPYTATARWSEYYPGDGEVGFMWRKMPKTMLGKCAEALALRKAFPKQLQGLYANEELDQADRPEAPRVTKAASARLVPEEDRSQPDDASLFPTAEDDERGDLVKEITRLSQKLKLKEEQRATYRKTYLGGSDPLDTNLDIVALRELTDALLERAGEPKRKAVA